VTKSKENEMNEACRTQEGSRSELRVYIGKEKERVHLEDLYVDGRLVFK
jgi:hypothetical protein